MTIEFDLDHCVCTPTDAYGWPTSDTHSRGAHDQECQVKGCSCAAFLSIKADADHRVGRRRPDEPPETASEAATSPTREPKPAETQRSIQDQRDGEPWDGSDRFVVRDGAIYDTKLGEVNEGLTRQLHIDLGPEAMVAALNLRPTFRVGVAADGRLGLVVPLELVTVEPGASVRLWLDVWQAEELEEEVREWVGVVGGQQLVHSRMNHD